MKKLKLNELNLSNTEVLSREQLKKVLGGLGSGGMGSDGYPECHCCSNIDHDNCSTAKDLTSHFCSSLQSAQSACEEYAACGSGTFIKGACVAN